MTVRGIQSALLSRPKHNDKERVHIINTFYNVLAEVFTLQCDNWINCECNEHPII